MHRRSQTEEGTETGQEHVASPSTPAPYRSAILMKRLGLGTEGRGKESRDVWLSKDAASHLQIPAAAGCHSLQASCPGYD